MKSKPKAGTKPAAKRKPKSAAKPKAPKRKPEERVHASQIPGPVDLSDCLTREAALAKLRRHYESTLSPAEFANLVNEVVKADTGESRDRWIFTVGRAAATLADAFGATDFVPRRMPFDPKPKRVARHPDVGQLVDLKVRNLATGRWRTYLNLETLDEVQEVASLALPPAKA